MKKNPTNVLLLHGLWMRGFSMQRLALRLRAEGFRTHLFDYFSLAHEPAQTEARIAARIRELGSCHVLGHSLGGVMALRTLLAEPHLPVARVVCLGSPLTGASAARTMHKLTPLNWLLGKSGPALLEGLREWRGQQEVGVIAGRIPLGMAMWMPGLGQHSDGTVAMAETRLPGIRAHVEIAATHSGLLFSDEAARLSAAFLHSGEFSSRE
jgi:pimeloyl-ACP methyl ester carboxylesterase